MDSKKKKAYTVEEAHQQWLEEQQQAKRPRESEVEEIPSDPAYRNWDDEEFTAWRHPEPSPPLSPYSARAIAHGARIATTRDEDEIQDHMEYDDDDLKRKTAQAVSQREVHIEPILPPDVPDYDYSNETKHIPEPANKFTLDHYDNDDNDMTQEDLDKMMAEYESMDMDEKL